MAVYRQQKIKKNLMIRAQIVQIIRRFFIDHDYLEVETPVRIPAPAPEAHIDAVASGDWYLQTSPELCMKRLLAAGFARMFQICKCFRRGDRGRLHLPEMTLLEWYRAESNYLDMMDESEALIRCVAQQLTGEDVMIYQGTRIELKAPWHRISVAEAFEKFASSSIEKALEEDRFDVVMVEEIEPALSLARPVFLYDYPAARAALAGLKPQDNRWAERFELYIGGLELCNAFSELTDPAEQQARFERELQRRREAGRRVWPLPATFLDALKDMPEAAGNALGIDRLVMLFADTKKIEDAVAFTPEEL